MSTKQATCAERVESRMLSRLEDLARMQAWAQYADDPDDYEPKVESNLYEYGLCFDYVEPGTFDGQRCGYWRYQLSSGGPSDEFRLYGGGRVEYRFHDWYDGAGIWLDDVSSFTICTHGVDGPKTETEIEPLELLQGVFEWFLDCQEERHGF